jgi:uncharacterized protein (TIGR02594 family)
MIPLPEKYQWLTKVRQLPNTIKECIKLHGTQEVVGKGSNATIIGWRDELNQNGAIISGYSDDDIAWCGLYAAIVTYRRMKNIREVVREPLWARNWLKYGVRPQQPGLGDVLVFERGSGGHVGFYVGEDSQCYHVFGGNQSDKVCITRVKKDRLLGARRPIYSEVPKSVKPYLLGADGAVSTNEA